MKDRPVRIVGRYLKAPTVGLDDRPTNGKTHSDAGGFCRKECLEDTVFVLLIYSRPSIFNGNHNTGRLRIDIGRYPQRADPTGAGYLLPERQSESSRISQRHIRFRC